MRALRMPLFAVALALVVGCSWIDKIRTDMKGKSGPPVQKVSAEQLVEYLNGQASRMQSVTYSKATVTAKQGLIPLPSLRGNLAATQPRNFRMMAQGGISSAKIDLGSNTEQFWMYVDAPSVNSKFVYASYSDFESGRAKLPEGIPFEPDWVMQALGMITLPTTTNYDPVKLDERARTYTLSWPAATPAGIPIRKEIVIAVDDADSSRNQPQVLRHVIRNAKGNVICSAEIKRATTVQVGSADSRTNRPPIVQYPTHIVLRWEEQRFEMDLLLDGAQVNPQLTAEQLQKHFSRPTIPGATPINLAEARFELPGR